MGASVRMEDFAFSDERFDLLAVEAGLADADHARGKVMRLWRTCTLRQSTTLPENIVSVVLPPDALVAADLAERVPGGLRIKGTAGRIEWYGHLQQGRSAGGRARSEKAVRDERGRMVSQQPSSSPAGCWTQVTSSSHPALSSVLIPSPSPVLIQEPPITPPSGNDPRAGLPAGPLAAGPAASQPSSPKKARRKGVKPGDPNPEELAAIERVISKLNERTGCAYEAGCKETQRKLLKLLRERRPGEDLRARERDIRLVVWDRANRWANEPDMADFVRPKTLFGAVNFADYVVQARAAWAKSPDNPENRRAEQAAAVEGA